jgi:cellobiose phosphorylase
MYRLVLESLLGLRREGCKLRVEPCIPSHWSGFKVHYRYGETVYHICLLQDPAEIGETSVTVDGVMRPDGVIALLDDAREHVVEVRLRAAESVPS